MTASGSITGTQFGFHLGRRAGRAMLARTSRRRLDVVVKRSEELLARYGHRKAILVARFVPLVRTVLGPVAGTLGVPVGTFTLWQAIGGLAWTQSLILAGYWLGTTVPGVEKYLPPLVALAATAPLLPIGLRHRTRPGGRVRASARARSGTRNRHGGTLL